MYVMATSNMYDLIVIAYLGHEEIADKIVCEENSDDTVNYQCAININT